jgi:flagellar L-ring protein precursor FlgH
MKRWILATLASIGVATPIGRADSIWDRKDNRYAYLFEDNRARHIGDIVTVSISETTTADNADTRSGTKTTNATASLQIGNPPGTAPTSTGGPLFTATSSRTFNGSAAYQTSQVFTDQIAATVVDIMPNGNLVIEGYRSRVVAGEERVLRLTGVIRQVDVGTGNVIASTSVANFRISYLGRGPASRFANQNYGGRIFNRLWPF